jgi:hypothetical protein
MEFGNEGKWWAVAAIVDRGIRRGRIAEPSHFTGGALAEAAGF